ncbi:hypothetical protein MTF66_03540 [Pseudoalteromonas sp. 2CM39R]|uniref:hypothetical protein n=1 Tax=Pseudoalteromonas sp. 2CM39R TaxID=2929856 RepID=UPI0020BFE495|nr:hypothetical protein [Pseudoalteromonas sp. 2CM39R]MCK8124057.1 hypothetical protein [Pseudoalteromonas sp. 2CM39R]
MFTNIYSLLGNSDKYLNKEVNFSGYLVRNTGGIYELYPSKSDSEFFLKDRYLDVITFYDGVNLLDACVQSYVFIQARFTFHKDNSETRVLDKVSFVHKYDENEKYTKFSPCYIKNKK